MATPCTLPTLALLFFVTVAPVPKATLLSAIAVLLSPIATVPFLA